MLNEIIKNSLEYILQLQSEYEKILNQRWSKNKPS